MIDFQALMQMMGQQGQGPGILGQEIGAQSMGGPGFLGQVDAQPMVGAAQQGQQFSPEMLSAMGQMGSQMMGPQQQQPQQMPPMQAPPMPQSRQTVGMPQMNDPMAAWLQRRNMPQLGPLGGSM